ncbi:MAG: hypothetical protein KC425_22110 [Anaerolineales bacterium]|nr:hypothetical protein [Anaerolineales bacterium]
MNQVPLQRRQHPIFSPIALLSTLLLVIGLSVALWLTGGRAFNPGALSAVNHGGVPVGEVLSHAEVTDDCSACHTPFQGVDAARCERCHTAVAIERQSDGLHGRFPNAERCADCHQEHRGADFDLILSALDSFDHEVTAFSLAQHARDYDSAPLLCTACHAGERSFEVVLNACADCHGAADPAFMVAHMQDFGSDCLICHDGSGTLVGLTPVEHAEFFALDGRHADVSCAGCHAGGQFEDTPTECAGCHAEPVIHFGLFGADCAACHTPQAWLPATLDGTPFDHAADTRFTLARHVTNVDGQPFGCVSCHGATENAADPFAFAESQCVDCHMLYQADFIGPHAAQLGDACLACHDGSGRMANFNHDQVWPLEGLHAAADCTACHADQVYAGTPRECVACHAEPAIHFGLFGTDCAACHNPGGWTPARLTQHDFPLDHGGEGEIACATCHTQTYTAYTCTNCHAHDPVETAREHLEEGIGADRLQDCAVCHPTGREDEAERFEDDD